MDATTTEAPNVSNVCKEENCAPNHPDFDKKIAFRPESPSPVPMQPLDELSSEAAAFTLMDQFSRSFSHKNHENTSLKHTAAFTIETADFRDALWEMAVDSDPSSVGFGDNQSRTSVDNAMNTQLELAADRCETQPSQIREKDAAYFQPGSQLASDDLITSLAQPSIRTEDTGPLHLPREDDLSQNVKELVDLALGDMDIDSLAETILTYLPYSPNRSNEVKSNSDNPGMFDVGRTRDDMRHERLSTIDEMHVGFPNQERKFCPFAAVNTPMPEPRSESASQRRSRGKPSLSKIKKGIGKASKSPSHPMVLRGKKNFCLTPDPRLATDTKATDAVPIKGDVPLLVKSRKKHPSAFMSTKGLDSKGDRKVGVRRNQKSSQSQESSTTDDAYEEPRRTYPATPPTPRTPRVGVQEKMMTPSGSKTDSWTLRSSARKNRQSDSGLAVVEDTTAVLERQARRKASSLGKSARKKNAPDPQIAPSRAELAEVEEHLRQLREQILQEIFRDTPIISRKSASKMRQTLVQKKRRLQQWNQCLVNTQVAKQLRNMLTISETLLYQLDALETKADDRFQERSVTPPTILSNYDDRNESSWVAMASVHRRLNKNRAEDSIDHDSERLLHESFTQGSAVNANHKRKRTSPMRKAQERRVKEVKRLQEDSWPTQEVIDKTRSPGDNDIQELFTKLTIVEGPNDDRVNAGPTRPAVLCENCFRLRNCPIRKKSYLSMTSKVDRATNTDNESTAVCKPNTKKMFVETGTNTEFGDDGAVEVNFKKAFVDSAVNTDFDNHAREPFASEKNVPKIGATGTRKSSIANKDSQNAVINHNRNRKTLPIHVIRSADCIWLPDPGEFIIESPTIFDFPDSSGCAGNITSELSMDFEWEYS